MGLRLILAAAVLLVGGTVPAGAQTTIEYYGLDAVGSVRVVFDAAGAVIARRDYDPFGREVVSAGTAPHRLYAGLFRDTEAALDYAQARSYQVRTGRFSAPDPVYAGLFEPQRWNRYSYGVNNPELYVDPSGLQACTLGDGRPGFCSGTVGTTGSGTSAYFGGWFGEALNPVFELDIGASDAGDFGTAGLSPAIPPLVPPAPPSPTFPVPPSTPRPPVTPAPPTPDNDLFKMRIRSIGGLIGGYAVIVTQQLVHNEYDT